MNESYFYQVSVLSVTMFRSNLRRPVPNESQWMINPTYEDYELDEIRCIDIWIPRYMPPIHQQLTTYVRTVDYIITYYAQEVLPYGQTTCCIK